jgi:surface antigen
MLALSAGSSLALAGISASDQIDAKPVTVQQPVEQADHYVRGGYVYGAPAVIYRAPPPVYVVPAPVYVAPAPVVVAPAPVYPAPVYVAPPAPVANRIVCRGSNNGAILGGAIGGVTGAAIGASASRHHPWEAATGGSILGVLLGSAIGHAVDAGDQYCTTQAVVTAPIGQPVYWVNPATGVQYQMVPTRQYVQWNTTCRDYQASALVNGRWQMIRGTTCLQPDGSWQIVSG